MEPMVNLKENFWQPLLSDDNFEGTQLWWIVPLILALGSQVSQTLKKEGGCVKTILLSIVYSVTSPSISSSPQRKEAKPTNASLKRWATL